MSIKMSRTTMGFWPGTIVHNRGAGINGFFTSFCFCLNGKCNPRM